ncbi:MAG: hypothetical protein AAF591_21335, partial [Verrucomicrobiota bacterium]
MFRPLTYLMVLFFVAGSVMEVGARTWTSSYGKAIEGELVGFDGETVELKLADGRMSKFKVSLLSEDDQLFLREWKEHAPPEPVNREWPEVVEVDVSLDDIVIVEEVREKERYVYRSPHFEFVANARLSKSVVREFSRVFEGTLEAVRALPINLDPKPPEDGFWDVKLYKTRDQYLKDGGPPGSAGVYMGGSGMVKVPLPNLGVEYTGIRYIVDTDKTNRTLKHEITHQVMHEILRYMPVWMVEGFAEFVESMPYSKGKYRFNDVDDAVKERAAGDNRDYEMADLQSLMLMDHATWGAALTQGGAGKNYNSSCVLLYYFLKVDGAGDGTGIFSYLDEVRTAERRSELEEKRVAAREKYLLRDRSYEQLMEEVAVALRSN